jgi:hypothetical protein
MQVDRPAKSILNGPTRQMDEELRLLIGLLEDRVGQQVASYFSAS